VADPDLIARLQETVGLGTRERFKVETERDVTVEALWQG